MARGKPGASIRWAPQVRAPAQAPAQALYCDPKLIVVNRHLMWRYRRALAAVLPGEIHLGKKRSGR